MEGVMKRQDPERTDLGDSSAASNSMEEVKRLLMKKLHMKN
jgi:hypothetical protein